MPNLLILGAKDFRAGLRMYSVWLALASEDINDQHKRTLLGPAWILLSYLAFAGTFVIIFGQGSGIPNFATYVAIGLFVWLYLSETVTQSVSLFIREESLIKGTTLPLTVYVLRMATQLAIRAGYALIGCAGIVLVFGDSPSVTWLWIVPSIVLVLVTAPAAITIFAVAGAYFPDLQFFVTNAMRIGLFLTPIFWLDAEGTGIRGAIYRWNPFTYFLEIVRTPVYEGLLPAHAFNVCILISIAIWLGALLLLGKCRKGIAYIL